MLVSNITDKFLLLPMQLIIISMFTVIVPDLYRQYLRLLILICNKMPISIILTIHILKFINIYMYNLYNIYIYKYLLIIYIYDVFINIYY